MGRIGWLGALFGSTAAGRAAAGIVWLSASLLSATAGRAGAAEAPLGAIPVPHFSAALERLGRCPESGDALVTLEQRDGEGDPRVVVRRDGRRCFQLHVPEGRAGLPIGVAVSGTLAPDGSAGPLAVVYGPGVEGPAPRSGSGRASKASSHAAAGSAGEPGLAGGAPRGERSNEVHLLVATVAGELLLDRALALRTGSDEPGNDREVRVVPLVFSGERLIAWASVRSREPGRSRCEGSLLTLPSRGPIEVAEGLPCAVTLTADVDTDGTVELLAVTPPVPGELAPWQAAVSLEGELLASWTDQELAEVAPVALASGAPGLLALGGQLGPLLPELVLAPFPWSGARRRLPAGDGPRVLFDLDGDGSEELAISHGAAGLLLDLGSGARTELPGPPLAGRIDGRSRELLLATPACGVAAFSGSGLRCAPGEAGGLGGTPLVLPPFDWTGDGSEDVTLVAKARDGTLTAVTWAEGDATWSRPVLSPAELLPLHQAPRALLLGGNGPGVLLRTPDGFVLVAAGPWGQVTWRAPEEVVAAWAIPASGSSRPGR